MLDDISNAADEDTNYSMMDLRELVGLKLKKILGKGKYDEIIKSNFG